MRDRSLVVVECHGISYYTPVRSGGFPHSPASRQVRSFGSGVRNDALGVHAQIYTLECHQLLAQPVAPPHRIRRRRCGGATNDVAALATVTPLMNTSARPSIDRQCGLQPSRPPSSNGNQYGIVEL